ncbi:MAG: hypothetical protein J5787_02315 [Alphaproteobacteria bacterium]|nr:hypothetical protein [Alphaproteobacteria bacterium]
MRYLKKSAALCLMTISFFFCAGKAQAQIPVPTIGAELTTQMGQLMEHIEELKNMIAQIKGGADQLKSMGDKLSVEGILGMVTGQLGGSNGKEKLVGLTREFEDIGFSEETMKEPDKIAQTMDNVKSGLNQGGEYNEEKHEKCFKARKSMAADLAKKKTALSLNMQNKIATGSEMKESREATTSAGDQMSMLAALAKTTIATGEQMSDTSFLDAMDRSSSAIQTLCD